MTKFRLTVSGTLEFPPEDDEIKELLLGPYSTQQFEIAAQELMETATKVAIQLVEI